jgi:hypothetical protein
MDQNYQPQHLPSPSPLPPSPPLLPALLPTPNTSTTLEPLACPPLAIYSTREALFQAIQSWSKPRGYAFTVGKSLRKKGRQKVYYTCDRCPPTPLPKERIRDTQTRGTSCLFSVIALEKASGDWELKYRPEPQYNKHNHLPSQSPISHPSHRYLSTKAKDLYNQNAALRRNIQQGKSTTEALIQYLQESRIKHAILKDPATRRLKGLFIACPESIKYLQSHHDVY